MKEQLSAGEPADLDGTAGEDTVNSALATATARRNSTVDTLIIYTYSNSDSEYERNLQFFVRHGMWENDGCHYLIIVQQVSVSNTA